MSYGTFGGLGLAVWVPQVLITYNRLPHCHPTFPLQVLLLCAWRHGTKLSEILH